MKKVGKTYLYNKEEQELVNSALKKVNDYVEKNKDITGSKYIAIAVKNYILNNNIDLNINHSSKSKKEFNLWVSIVRYIITDIAELTPAQFADIYNSRLIEQLKIRGLIRNIKAEASPKDLEDTYFMDKRIIFKFCFPEFFEEYLKDEYTLRDVFENNTGELISAMKNAGKSKTVSNGARTPNNGGAVDAIVYKAMKQFLPDYNMMEDELLLSLAKPKAYEWNKYGFVEIIKARGCYPTPLDFYFLNSPEEYQRKNFAKYMKIRKEAKLETPMVLELYNEAFTKENEIIRQNNDYER